VLRQQRLAQDVPRVAAGEPQRRRQQGAQRRAWGGGRGGRQLPQQRLDQLLERRPAGHGRQSGGGRRRAAARRGRPERGSRVRGVASPRKPAHHLPGKLRGCFRVMCDERDELPGGQRHEGGRLQRRRSAHRRRAVRQRRQLRGGALEGGPRAAAQQLGDAGRLWGGEAPGEHLCGDVGRNRRHERAARPPQRLDAGQVPAQALQQGERGGPVEPAVEQALLGVVVAGEAGKPVGRDHCGVGAKG
jgi:hypothetical protein